MLQSFTFHPTVVVRTPTSPFTTEVSEPSLREHLADSYFAEALYLASPTLYHQSQKWLRGEMADRKEADKVLLSVAKYLNRKRSRCTPFGLFATSSVLQWGEASRIVVAEEKRRTRFSMSFLETLTQSLSTHPTMQPKLRYYPNSSIYTIGNEIRYVEYSSQEGRRTYQISAVAGADEIVDVISACQGGLSYTEVISRLVEQKIAKSDATLFVDALIQAQILVSELEPTVTGEDLLHRVKRVLQRIHRTHPEEPIGSLSYLLTGLEEQLQTLDQGQSDNLSLYEAITEQVTQLAVPFTATELFQVNTFRATADATLDHRWQEEIKRAMHVLTHLSPPAQNPSLEEFKRQFYNRYEEAEYAPAPGARYRNGYRIR